VKVAETSLPVATNQSVVRNFLTCFYTCFLLNFLDLPCSRRFPGFCENRDPGVVARTNCWFLSENPVWWALDCKLKIRYFSPLITKPLCVSLKVLPV